MPPGPDWNPSLSGKRIPSSRPQGFVKAAQWQGWTGTAQNFILVEPAPHRAPLKSIFEEDVHKGKGGKEE